MGKLLDLTLVVQRLQRLMEMSVCELAQTHAELIDELHEIASSVEFERDTEYRITDERDRAKAHLEKVQKQWEKMDKMRTNSADGYTNVSTKEWSKMAKYMAGEMDPATLPLNKEQRVLAEIREVWQSIAPAIATEPNASICSVVMERATWDKLGKAIDDVRDLPSTASRVADTESAKALDDLKQVWSEFSAKTTYSVAEWKLLSEAIESVVNVSR
jgi:hypothetical protein